MKTENTNLSALLNAIQRGRGYTVYVTSVKEIHGVVYIVLPQPYRTAKMTAATYDKIKDYIVISGH